MLEKGKGIVLKSTPYRENGLLLTLFTDTHGLIRVWARGVRRSKKNPPLYTEQFVWSEYTWFFGRGIPIVDSAECIEPFYKLRDSLDALSLGQYFTAVVATMPEATPDTDVLRLLLNSLHLLAEKKVDADDVKLVFEIKFAALQGFSPSGFFCEECGKAAERWVYDKGFLCASCAGREGFSLSEEALGVFNFILENEGARAYCFKCSPQEKRYLTMLMQHYLAHQLDTSFHELDYYGKY